MEVFLTTLTVIGGITALWLAYKILRGALILLSAAMVAAFREKYPNDFFMCIDWVLDIFSQYGYKVTETMDAGSIEPGVKMRKDDRLLEIRLHAPLTSGSQTISIIDDDNSLFISVPQASSEMSKSLLTILANE
jgi:hypothetical protein